MFSFGELYGKTNKLGLALESYTLFVGLYVFIELNFRIKKQDYLFLRKYCIVILYLFFMKIFYFY